MENKTQYIRVAQSSGELALRYGISTKALKRLLDKHREKIGERAGRYFTPKQVRIIYECLGPTLY